MKKSMVALTVVVAALLASTGTGSAAVSCAPGAAPPPAVVTDHETDVTLTSATLHGKVDPHGCATTYHFEYGTTTAYGSVTADTAAGSGTSSLLAATPITGLAAHTVYHFRIVATSAAGTTEGSDVLFRTKRACIPNGGSRPPAVVTDHASDVLPTSATLLGKVNAHGCPTTYQFQYGTTTAYGRVTPATEAGSGTHSVLAAAAISGLAPETFYHFRIVASSGAGTTYGLDERLKTPKSVPASHVEIEGHRAFVKRGFIARIRLRCALGSGPCQGRVTILLKHHLVGRQRYILAADTQRVVSVRLNRRGRIAMRQSRRRQAAVIATSGANNARGSVQLIRSFRR